MKCKECHKSIDEDNQSDLCLKCKLSVSSSSDTDSQEDFYKRVYEKSLRKKLPDENNNKMYVDGIKQDENQQVLKDTKYPIHQDVTGKTKNKEIKEIPIKIIDKIEKNELQSNHYLLESDSYFTVKFHIFIPPEFNFDNTQLNFGIISSYHKWGEDGYIPLNSHK
jgi:hypothetical protein